MIPTILLNRIALASITLLLASACAERPADQAGPSADEPLPYPPARTVDQIDDYHGVRIADPYRWLEEIDDPETRAWIEAENQLTSDWLAKIPERETIKDRLTELWNFERYWIPHRRGGRYFFEKNNGLQDHPVLYWAESLDAEERVLLDPNGFSEDGTISLSDWVPSEDGRLLAYGISNAGSDWSEWKVRDIDAGRDLPDLVEWVKFSKPSWMHDGSGFFYSRYDEPDSTEILAGVNYFQKLYFHRLNTAQSEDQLIYERPDQKEWGFGGHVTEDGHYLIISVWVGSLRKNAIFYKDLSDPDASIVELLDSFDAEYDFVGNNGTLFWFETDLDAPLHRLIGVDILRPGRAEWVEVIAEREEPLRAVTLVGDRFVARYLRDAYSVARVYATDGRLVGEIELPGLGSVYGFGGRQDSPETFYLFSSFTTPSTIYRYDVHTRESRVFKEPAIDFDPSDYETKQIFYNSKDSTRVPMFISHKKGLRLDGKNPTALAGYGGFRVSMMPYFSVSSLVWMEMGGVLAIPNLRGGGEYGNAWHEAGIKLNKQNTFDDFIAAAEWLIENDYTQTSKLAIKGGSNGGLLVGACLVQRPDLFGAAIPDRGVLDMLRFDKFTIGWAWASDYGSPGNPEEFGALHAYSPLHNVEDGVSYPPTMVITGDHDDRVMPAHSFKFAARLQAAQAGPAPILARIETRAGHGGGMPMGMLIEEVADVWAFLVHVLGMEN